MKSSASHQQDLALREFINRAGDHRLLTKQEELALAKRIERGDLAAKDELIRCNVRLVLSVAAKWGSGTSLEMADLVQEGMLGLIRAVEKFDWRKGFRFSTYAMMWISQSIQRGMTDKDPSIRIPTHIAQRTRKVALARQRLLAADVGAEPTVHDLAEATGLPAEEIEALDGLSRVAASLDQPVGDDGDTTLANLIGDRSVPGVEATVLADVTVDTIRGRIDALPHREAQIVRLRFGLDEEPLTHAAIAQRVGTSRAVVRSLEARALERLATDREMRELRFAA
jgi:RNA polymerase primary sigma factor